MKNCRYNYPLALNEVESTIRKPAYWYAPQFFINLTVNDRVSLELIQGFFNTQKKIMAKTISLFFVEVEVLVNIKLGFFPNCKRVVHLLGQYSSFDT
jgi:hypothetical protein